MPQLRGIKAILFYAVPPLWEKTMNDCPNCEYHKNRAARWRAEAYAQAGHDIIERPWVEIDGDDWIKALELSDFDKVAAFEFFESKLKEKNS